MSSKSSSKHSYWLEAALRGALGPPPQPIPKPKTFLSSALQTLGISTKPISTKATSNVLPIFDGISSKRILIAGLDCGGKTTLLNNHISLDATRTGKDIETRIPFIGINIKTLSYPSSEIYWYAMDIGGCSPNSYRLLERAVCEQADAIIWVVDTGDRDRLAETKEEFDRCLNVHGKSWNEYLGVQGMVQRSPICVMANKQDREGGLSTEEIRAAFKHKTDQLGDRAWSIHETSFQTGKGIPEAFEWVANQLRAKDSISTSEKRNSVSEESVGDYSTEK